MIEVLAGVLVGVITGIVPGLHINTFIPLLIAFPGLTGFVMGVTISHSFFDFLPAMFLGIPDEASCLSVLPAHKLILEGQGLKAFRLTVLGGVGAGITTLLSLPALLAITQRLRPNNAVVITILAAVTAALVLTQKNRKNAALVVALSGILGMAALQRSESFIMPLLSGSFGASAIIHSLTTHPRIPKQETSTHIKPSIGGMILGGAAGMFAGLTPAISSAIAATAARVAGDLDEEGLLVALGGTNTAYAITSVLAIFVVGHARSGAGLLIRGWGAGLTEIIGCSMLAVGAAGLLAMHSSRAFVSAFDKLPNRLLNAGSMLLIIGLVFATSGPWGIVVMISAAALGMYSVRNGVWRSACMASLLFPTIAYYATCA
ncbi:MAG: tripartite tricarboxylate transporter permease [Candidatus Diapherotrites archaeon]|nr:tripartite tricarboxylate transporter permease [Candidatus Diapherotrites archaeon]